MTAALVQTANNKTTTANVTATFAADTTVGNCLVANIGTFDTAARTIDSVTIGGSADNFASALNQTATESFIAQGAIWLDQGSTVSGTAIEATFSATVSEGILLTEEWSGIQTSSAVDKTASAGATQTADWSSGSTGTLTDANEVVLGLAVCFTEGTNTITGPGSPWTNLAQVSATEYALMAGYQVVSATTAQTYSGTQTDSTIAVNVALILSLVQEVTAITGSGGVALSPLGLAGSGTYSIGGDGSLALGPLALAGSGTYSIGGSGELALGTLALAGEGQAGDNVVADGSFKLSPLGLAGSGTFSISGSGSLALGPLKILGYQVAPARNLPSGFIPYAPPFSQMRFIPYREPS